MASTWPELHAGTTFGYIWDPIGLEWIKAVAAAAGVGGAGDASAANQVIEIARLTSILAAQTQPGVDIGDVTINNSTGAAAVNIQDGGNSITVDGTFFQATQPVSLAAAIALAAGSAVIGHVIADTGSTTAVTGNVTVVQGTGSNLHVVLDSGTLSTITNVVHIDDNASSITVDGAVSVTGSVTANAGTNLNTSALALEATLQSVKTAVETIDNFISGTKGLVTEDNSSAILSRANLLLADATLTARLNTLGQKTMANSTPVVISSDQGAIPITGSISATSAATPTVSRPAYVEGTSSALSQTPDGLLRVRDEDLQRGPLYETMQAMLLEMRVLNSQIRQGLLVKDELDLLRRDEELFLSTLQ